MNARKTKPHFDHSGSSFDDFLMEEGIRDEVEAVAAKRVFAWELSQAMRQQHRTKQGMAKMLRTSRSQVDRLLDPNNTSVSLLTMARAAQVLGKRLLVSIADANARAPKARPQPRRRQARLKTIRKAG